MSNKDYKKLYLVTDYRLPFNELLEKTKEYLLFNIGQRIKKLKKCVKKLRN